MTTRAITKIIRLITLLLLPTYMYGQEPQRLTLLFVGDLMQHQAQIDAARRSDGTYALCARISHTAISTQLRRR